MPPLTFIHKITLAKNKWEKLRFNIRNNAFEGGNKEEITKLLDVLLSNDDGLPKYSQQLTSDEITQQMVELENIDIQQAELQDMVRQTKSQQNIELQAESQSKIQELENIIATQIAREGRPLHLPDELRSFAKEMDEALKKAGLNQTNDILQFFLSEVIMNHESAIRPVRI